MTEPRSKSNLPPALEDKNELDFKEVTNRIWSAIEKISLNPKLKPTQAVLAKLASVSRGTINNRKWPLDELNKIKANRKQSELETALNKKIKPDGQTEMDTEDRLYLSREQVRVWKVKADEEKRKVIQLEAIVQTQQAQIELLKSEVTKMAEIISDKKVVPIWKSPKN